MNNEKSISSWQALQRCSILAACAATLAACGGGGGGGGDATAPAPAPAPGPAPAPAPATLADPDALMQGFWSGTVASGPEGSTRASAVIMPGGTAWIAHETATGVTGLSKVALTGAANSATSAALTGAGFYYSQTGAARQGVTATGTVTSTSLTGTMLTGGSTATLDWASVAGFRTPALAADATGTWRGTVGTGVVQVTWTVTAAGGLSGNSTTGCSYSGLLKPTTAAVAVYDFATMENCAGTIKNLVGIATLNAAKTSLRVVFTADSEASGGLIALTRQ